MKLRHWFILLLFFILAAGCGSPSIETSAPAIEQTPTLKLPGVNTTPVPDASAAARIFLDAWKANDYASMYALLTTLSKDAMSQENFEKHYRGIETEMALSGIDYEILSALVVNPTSAQVGYKLTFHSTLVDDIQKETRMDLDLEQGQWRIKWDDSLVMTELAGDNYLGMERYTPARANIYDRNGHALVAQTDATAIGLVPGQIDPDQEERLFTWLVRLTGLTADQIRARYENFPPGVDWYLPLGEVPADEIASNIDTLSGLSGLVLEPYRARYYFDGGVAPHVVGYVTTIQAGEEEEYMRKGYQRDERVGQAGLEYWGENMLSGKRGGALYLFNAQGQILTRLAEREAVPAQSITTTLDRDFQENVERAISGFLGAVVVLERDTGRVLAMASSPDFDPNAFEPRNRNSSALLEDIYSDPASPTFNRATQGQYPAGSAFKPITMAAALESGLYTPETTYECGYFFTELAGVTLNDWTYEYFLEDGKMTPSGLLNLPEGLVRSCNPFFWHIGLDLFNQDKTHAIADMARSFGLGTLTGIQVIDEEPGNVPLPQSEVDATNLAIGQGDSLVTPLQMADMMAAIGNGGTLYRPQIIERIAPPDGPPTFEFKPEVRGKLPIRPETLKVIQDALVGVVRSTKPYGTAWHRFTGLDIAVAGKTGTAQSGFGDPHAWFVGYTFEAQEDKPDIAIAVIMENIGQGSDYAAPVFRRVVELYFYGRPTKLYPWETGFYVTRTPVPEGEVVETEEP
jgi:penicillin-binding protein 2